VFVLAVVALSLTEWRSRHGVEVWHAAADAPA